MPTENGDELLAGVSVVLPTYQGRDLIPAALDSLAAQTLSRDLMEVVVVPNGKDDGTVDLVERFRSTHPDLHVRVVESKTPGVSLALNAGLFAARRRFFTVLDDDDYLAPEFLFDLLNEASDCAVTVGRLANVASDGAVDWENVINAALRGAAGVSSSTLHCHHALSFNACKLTPTAFARTIGYDPSLPSGSDVLFYMKLFAFYPLRLAVSRSERAVYYRLLRANSVSRRSESYEFSVLERLAVISKLDALSSSCDGDRERLLRFCINAQALFIRRYLESRPDDVDRVEAEIASRGIASFPWSLLKPAA